jgi:hypothetical protein
MIHIIEKLKIFNQILAIKEIRNLKCNRLLIDTNNHFKILCKKIDKIKKLIILKKGK